MAKLDKKLDKNKKVLEETFHYNSDIKLREFVLKDKRSAFVIYMEGVADVEGQRDLLSSLMSVAPKAKTMASFIADVIPNFGATELKDIGECVESVLRGDSVLVVEGETSALMIATASWPQRAIGEPPTSSVLRGPREGFNEDLKQNLTQIRRRLQSPDLMFDRMIIGRCTHTDVAVIYLGKIADPTIVKKIKERLSSIDIDGVLDSNYLQQYLEEHTASLFQQVGSCEKPDILSAKLLEGRVGIMVNGSPIVLTLPFLLFENIQQSEDYYVRRYRAIFLRVLRMFGVLLGVMLPAIYVSVQIYHYTVIPLSYLYTLMNAVQGLPMTPLMEMVFVLLLFEIIHEASFRMPKYVGMAMSVVGALVLGDTAVKAGLISSPSIMIVAISAIALYTTPDFVGSFKLLRILFCIIGGISGLWGLTLVGTGFIIYLANMDTYGTPYLAPYAPLITSDLKDGVFLQTRPDMLRRPKAIPNINKTRQNKPAQETTGKGKQS